ncbi:MAG TPA: c(7)-type cytochrome triheme domain-containing protein [Ramlibacter sp.]|uniref:c(7)-type cytochrome triheme domain-containing protein n=1 Tax=Ramlibacter sp. TaxID=1917967 RepID=UPI002D7F904C|nr:c(7)-type cytochrome triheme domain-containing protein [Ramlibacter sp.]HET8745017.1 c(7)-type cytochrome triheme domain-containing protein [Ramlibacter sp.]
MAKALQDFLLARRARSLAAALALVTGALAIAGGAAAQAQGALPELPEDLFGALPEPATEAGPPPPVHDPANPDHAKLQQPKEAFAVLPSDARGRPDWVRALREGAIQPRASVRGDAAMQVLELDVLMKNTAQMPYVKFPHGAHTQWLACANCHDALFVPKAGANPTTMPKILAGESCGVCHAKVAFTAMFTCERCHSEPQPGQQRWW